MHAGLGVDVVVLGRCGLGRRSRLLIGFGDFLSRQRSFFSAASPPLRRQFSLASSSVMKRLTRSHFAGDNEVARRGRGSIFLTVYMAAPWLRDDHPGDEQRSVQQNYPLAAWRAGGCCKPLLYQHTTRHLQIGMCKNGILPTGEKCDGYSTRYLFWRFLSEEQERPAGFAPSSAMLPLPGFRLRDQSCRRPTWVKVPLVILVAVTSRSRRLRSWPGFPNSPPPVVEPPPEFPAWCVKPFPPMVAGAIAIAVGSSSRQRIGNTKEIGSAVGVLLRGCGRPAGPDVPAGCFARAAAKLRFGTVCQ
jgi:hypothetical protein